MFCESTPVQRFFRFVLVITYALANCMSSAGQKSDTIRDVWIESMSDQLAFDISLTNLYDVFEVQTNNTKLTLYPNTPTKLGLKLNYRFLSVGFKVSPDFLPSNGDEQLKGKTKSIEMATSFIFSHLFFNLNYFKVKGYYLEDSEGYGERTPDEPYIQFPDLHYKGFSVLSGYYNNTRFSFKHLTTQTERQLRSAGSFMPVLNFRYYSIDDKSAAVNTQKTSNIELGIGPGYAHTFVINEKFYGSLGMLTEFGVLKTKLTTRLSSGDTVTKQNNIILGFQARVGLGYNNKRFYSGLYVDMKGMRYEQEHTTAVNSEARAFYRFFIGYRISAPSFIKKPLEKIEI
ncbi:DUF4421 family protein [Carboxylicivirga sp. A043]|uniref:DUF4421 domain-containing protein n=1 Tax=Carboxylicivirga litoralis TaxID=2816963 RepID=UPI0021CB396B|nr:DUF4421 domain-containing protein [Carboxylicivirga sp. A043]MCU4156519.1 DUF4421 family protein [Carboxylicivirga sp. A043]